MNMLKFMIHLFPGKKMTKGYAVDRKFQRQMQTTNRNL